MTGESPEWAFESRLRAALAAQARQVTVERLRPASPPAPGMAGRWWHTAPGLSMAAGLAVAATILAVAFVLYRPAPVVPDRQPDAPADAPPAVPSTPAAPEGPAPSPSPSRGLPEATGSEPEPPVGDSATPAPAGSSPSAPRRWGTPLRPIHPVPSSLG